MSTLLPALAWALLDFVWQGLLVGWGAALMFSLMRSARPQARYLVGCGALLLCIALPLSGRAGAPRVMRRSRRPGDSPASRSPMRFGSPL